MSTTTEAPKKNRTVLDQHGQTYELTGRIGEGGQGVVCTTNYPNVLVKVARATTEEKRANWANKIRALMRQPLEGLPIAHPLALITQPQPGYVMELMDGLAPMTDLMQVATDGLWIEPSASARISLQRASDDKVVAVARRQRLKSDSRSGTSFWLHLGAVDEEHVVWRFNW
ncbi:MAG: hypothetical protein J0M01_03870 [Dechloromonas sp.]|jgi:hypothetical protein|nr:hypothetical protein [Dechloromonas sp.]